MFEALTERMTDIFRQLHNHGRLTEKDVDGALREVRLALLEADVHFQVARELVARVKIDVVGMGVLESINPSQQVIKAVNEELTAILGNSNQGLLSAAQPPSIVLLVGLQGSGKTTTASKLAFMLRKRGHRPLLVAADQRRPAAIEQLVALGKQLDIPVYHDQSSPMVVDVVQGSIEKAAQIDANWILVDTGGRLHVDDDLMEELEILKVSVTPVETLLVVDAMTGQDAVRVAGHFHEKLGLTGLILTKLDGDARGGAALSVVHVTGVPIKFVGLGEKSDALESFHPERMASRILGMGDILTLIEKSQEHYDQEQVQELERKIRRASFDLSDFQEQLQQVKKMGSVGQILEMLPGFSRINQRLNSEAIDDGKIGRIEAIISSMTLHERANPGEIH